MKRVSQLLVIGFLFSVLVSCTQEPNKTTEPVKVKVNPNPQRFFIGDEITHYTCVKADSLGNTYNKVSRSFYSGTFPDSVNNPHFEKELRKYFKGKHLSQAITNKIHSILSNTRVEHDSDWPGLPYCRPEYNDILVFKQNDKTTGIAKLCFQCPQFNLIGHRYDDEYFGTNSDFITLQKVLSVKE